MLNLDIVEIISGDSSYLKQYTKLLQKTYEATYVEPTLGLTKECFSKEIFNNSETQKYLASKLKNNDLQHNWLAIIDDKLVGSISILLISTKEAELSGFYVEPAYQGQGIGKKLYQLAVEFAGGRDLILDIYLHNKKTIGFYKKWGWQIDTSRGNNGYFYRHWPEWPADLQAKAVYMRLTR